MWLLFTLLVCAWCLLISYTIGREAGIDSAAKTSRDAAQAEAKAKAEEVVDGDDEPDDDDATCLAIGMPVNAYLSSETIVRGIVQGFMVRPDKDGKHHHVVLVEVGRHAVTVFEPDDVDPDDSLDRHAVASPTYRDPATKPDKDVN